MGGEEEEYEFCNCSGHYYCWRDLSVVSGKEVDVEVEVEVEEEEEEDECAQIDWIYCFLNYCFFGVFDHRGYCVCLSFGSEVAY